MALTLSSINVIAIRTLEADLPLGATGRDLLHLLVDFLVIFLAPLVSLEFPHLLGPLDLLQQLLIWLVKLVLIILVEVLLRIEHPLINRLQELILIRLKPILE